MSSLRVVWVDVQGFRRLQERSFFDFRDPRGDVSRNIVIAGTNGSGKTTLLEAILFGLGREDLILRDLSKAARGGAARGRLPPGARVSICVEYEGQFLRSDRANGKPSWSVVPSPLAAVGPYADVRFGASADTQVEYYSSWRAPALLGPVWPVTRGRKPAATEANRMYTLKQGVVNRRTVGSYGVRGLSEDSALVKVNRAWQRLHEGDGTRIVDQPVNSDDAEGEDGFDLFVIEPDGRRRCSVDALSAGEIEMLSFAGALAGRPFRGVLIVDEPELHLHPQWQSQIVPALHELAPEAQVIVASHAESPWDRASNYQRYFLASDGDARRSELAPPPELR